MRHLFRMVRQAMILGMFCLGIGSVPTATEAGQYVEFILDGSGSMWAAAGNETKIEGAKRVLKDLVQRLELSSDSTIGLTVYGHRRKEDCEDIERFSAVSYGEREKLLPVIEGISPKGKTPIASSLLAVGGALKGREESTQVVLVSDGIESCDKDPCDVAKQLRSQYGINVTIHVVGFDIKEGQEQLQCVAKEGGGRYLSAANAGELATAMEDVKAELIRADAGTAAPKPAATALPPEPTASPVAETHAAIPMLGLFAKRNYGSYENSLHSELSINDQLVNIYSTDSQDNVTTYFKPGWNTIGMKTNAAPPCIDNHLNFSIGPITEAPDGRITMQPTLWSFSNGEGWSAKDGKCTHQLGPTVQEVTLSYRVHLGDLAHELQEMKENDHVVQGRSNYGSYNVPIVATVFINGSPITSFLGPQRYAVITNLLKPGQRNEVKLHAARVANSVVDNSTKISVMGPARWNVAQNKFLLPTAIDIDSNQGWAIDKNTGRWTNQTDPTSDVIERTVPFVVR